MPPDQNIHGQQFIDCFYGYHTVLSPRSKLWPKDKFDCSRTRADVLFVDGPDDIILQCTYLTDFYKNGFKSNRTRS